MRWLLSSGGEGDERFAGVLTSPGQKGVPGWIREGGEWAADNQAYTQGFDEGVFFPWLDGMLGWREKCLFVAVPDVVGDARATIEGYWRWMGHFTGWPIAFVAQDGQEGLEFPGDEWQVLFVGGTTKWKEGVGALECIKRAQGMGKGIHIGRVNDPRRYRLFRQIKGSEGFTCDGTKQRYIGIERAKEHWAGIQERTHVMELF